MSAREYVYPERFEIPMVRVAKNAIDSQPPARVTLSPELREYYVERRRALLTELKALDKLLSISTTK